MQFIRNLGRLLRPSRRLVGTDLDGNKYYEIARSGGNTGNMANRTKREVVTKLKHDQYTPGTIPVEWEAWIRGKRAEPPTHEELIARTTKQTILQQRVKQVEKKEEERRARELEDGLVHASQPASKPVGHASAPVYRDLNMEPEPTTTSKGFQPGAWTPGSATNDKGGEGETDNESFEPSAWMPPSKNK